MDEQEIDRKKMIDLAIAKGDEGTTGNLFVPMSKPAPWGEGDLPDSHLPHTAHVGGKYFFLSPSWGEFWLLFFTLSTGSSGVYNPSKIVSVCKKCVLKTFLRGISRGLA